MSTNNSSSGGLHIGCIPNIVLGILIVGGGAGVWMWANGADPRTAAHDGLILGAQVIGGGCAVMALIVAGVFGLAIFGGSSRRRW